MTAILHTDGTLDLHPWYDIPSGQATPSMPSDYTVRVLDGTGQLLSETGIPVSFKIATEALASKILI